MPLPNHLSSFRIQTEPVPHRTQGDNASASDDRCGPRAGRIADAIGAIVSVLPNLAPRVCIQTEDALGASQRRDRVVAGLAFERGSRLTVEHEYAVAHDGGAAITTVYRGAPPNRRPILRKLFDNALLAPDTITLRAQPLRPGVGEGAAKG